MLKIKQLLFAAFQHLPQEIS